MNLKWKSHEIDAIRRNYKTMSDNEIAKLLKKPVASVTKFRQRLGLKKSEDGRPSQNKD